MWTLKTQRARRTGVVANYLGVALLAAAVCLGEYRTWSPALATTAFVLLAIVVVAFVVTYLSTGIWKLAHSDSAALDERQMQVAYDGFRRSYTALAVIAMLLLVAIVVTVRFSFFTLTWRGHYAFGMVALMFMNYLIQTLPASFLAWRERYAPAESAP